MANDPPPRSKLSAGSTFSDSFAKTEYPAYPVLAPSRSSEQDYNAGSYGSSTPYQQGSTGYSSYGQPSSEYQQHSAPQQQHQPQESYGGYNQQQHTAQQSQYGGSQSYPTEQQGPQVNLPLVHIRTANQEQFVLIFEWCCYLCRMVAAGKFTTLLRAGHTTTTR